jgi:hypothetical protein
LESCLTYGLKSVNCWEHRVIQAYHLGHLTFRDNCVDQDTQYCTACGATGHKQFDCPTLILKGEKRVNVWYSL